MKATLRQNRELTAPFSPASRYQDVCTEDLQTYTFRLLWAVRKTDVMKPSILHKTRITKCGCLVSKVFCPHRSRQAHTQIQTPPFPSGEGAPSFPNPHYHASYHASLEDISSRDKKNRKRELEPTLEGGTQMMSSHDWAGKANPTTTAEPQH